MINYFDLSKEELTQQLLDLQLKFNTIIEATNARKIEEIERIEGDKLHRSLFENSIQGIVYQNSEGYIIDANPAAQRILGLTIDQMQGRTSYDPRWMAIREDGSGFPGDEHPAMLALKSNKIIKNSVMGVFNPVDEKFYWISINATPLLKEGETRPYLVYAVFEDITDRQVALGKLRDSESRYRLISENVTDIIWSRDIETRRFKYVSPSFEKLLGYTSEEAMGMEIEKILTPDSVQFFKLAVPDRLEQFINGHRESSTYVIDVINKNGEVVWLEITSKIMVNPDSGRIEATGVARDITAWKKVQHEKDAADEAFRVSENQLQSLFNTMSEGVVLINQDGKIIKANLAAENILGLSRTLIEGHYYISANWEIIREDGSPMPPAEMAGPRAMHEKQPVKDVIMGVRQPDKTFSWINVTASPIFDQQGHLMSVVATFTDITDKKLAEDAFKKMAIRNQIILQTATDGIHVVDHLGNLVEANPAFSSMLGYSAAEIMKLRVSDWDVKWSEEEICVKIEELMKRPATFETRHRRKDGTVLDVLINSASVVLDGQKYLYSSSRDITELKRSVQSVEQTKRNYRTFFNTVDDFLWVLDFQSKIMYTNNTSIRRLGYSFDELSGKSVLMVHPQNLKDEVELAVKDMLNGTVDFCTFPLMTKSGFQIPVETRVSQGFWDGNPVIFGVSKDITKIKLSEEKFSKSFYLNPSACGLSELTTGKYVEVNHAFETFFGFDKHEVIGKTASELGILSKERIDWIKNNSDVAERIVNAEAELKTKSGETKYVLLSSEKITVQNERYRFTVVNDITERILADREIKSKNEELVKANNEKDKFYSIIAHDLRSPFNAFLGFTSLLAEDYDSMSKDEVKEFFKAMNTSAINLFSLLENLLEWSRMQRGLKELKAVSFSLSQSISNNLQFLTGTATKKGVEISYRIPGNLSVFADENMFGSIIRNLVSNSLKFTPKGGKVIVSAKSTTSDMVEISVKDTGIGMSSQIKEHLFELGTQSGRRGTEGEPSTGLGLLLVSDFINIHGGRIWVDSVEGDGTTFYFTIPQKKDANKQSVTGSNVLQVEESVPTKPLKFLIVEDDQTSIYLLAAILKKITHDILFAETGKKAVEVARNNPDIDLIMMDLKLPEIDGFEATNQIRKFNEQVVIIAQTSFGLNNEKEKAKLAGCNDYMQKPYDSYSINKMIEKYFRI